MAGLLDLNDVARTLVFRKIVSFVRNDATIKRIVRPASIRAWDGKPEDGMKFDISIAPCIRFTPVNGPDVFWSPGSQMGPMFINVELLVKGTCIDDLLNFWGAIARAIYPAAQSSTNANVQALLAAGAWSGMAEFSMPAFDPEPSDNYFAGTGQIKIVVNNQLLTG